MDNITAGLKNTITGLKLLILDVDGVLTDGSINYSDDGTEFKSFNVRDGHGIKLLMRAGVDCAIITARSSEVVNVRAKDLGIRHVFQGQKEKLGAFKEVLSASGLKACECAYMGDDLIDLPVMRAVGLSAAPKDAVWEVAEFVDIVTEAPGGRGAVRELTEIILKLSGKWDEVTARYQ